MKIINKNRFLYTTLLAGLILLVISGGVLTFFSISERSISGSSRQQDSFYRILRQYDLLASEIYGTQREYDRLHGELDRLERRAIGVESWLSILKRRRALANIHPPSMENYRVSINNALKVYPSSAPITAIAAASLIKNTAINNETEEQLRELLPFFAENSFNNLRLAIHILLGDFRNPQRALSLPAGIVSDGSEFISVNLAVLKTLRADYRGAAADVQMMMNNYPTVNALRFAAEYNYDFGSLERSAEIFSLINDEYAMIRQADALYLAGYRDSASSIWSSLAEIPNELSLYNLAVTTNNKNTSQAWLEKLINLNTASNSDSRQFGLIHYSRMLDHTAALSLLRNTINLSPLNYPYIDLEICRRLAQERNPGRQVAETWLLLDRHSDNEELYRWASWLFFFQRRFDEAQILLDRMDLIKLNADWIDIYKALFFMDEGNLDAAENIFSSIPSQEAEWFVCANLGRIYETIRSPARALEQYELAAAKLQAIQYNPKIASRMQLRISRCFSALNRPGEARRTLQYALDLDPENLAARLDLDRFTY